MFSSVKFLSPIVTAGLPLPGPAAADPAGALVLPDEVDLLLELELPQAARPTDSASATPIALNRICFLLG
ncbi:MAG: hypothetical protein NVSMB51_07820 [Solirubrobacteraceae bacterium]